MLWSLEDIYKKQVRGNIPPRKHLRVLGEAKLILDFEDERDPVEVDVSPDQIRELSRYFKEGSGVRKDIEKYLASKLYNEHSFRGEDDYTNLVDMLDRGEFENYIITAKKPLLSKNPVGNLIDITSKSGFDPSMAARVARFKPIDHGLSNVGPGEILIALTFDDVTNATEGGDLMMGNEKLEVKGQLGRFGQQGGRGGVTLSLDPLLAGLEDKLEFPEKTGLEFIISQTAAAYNQEGKTEEFIPNLHKLLNLAYPGGNLDYFHEDLDFSELTSRKRPGGKAAIQGIIRRNLAKLNLDYYAREKKIKWLIFTKGEKIKVTTPGIVGDYVLFTVEDALKDGGLIDQGILVALSFTPAGLYPNWKYEL